jgi:uncharacterized protein YjbI with pentapeptide repeats
MDREELIRKYAGGEKDFTGRNFRGANWDNRIAREEIYQEADFTGFYSDLSGFDMCDLSFTKFVRARMFESGFGQCYMPGVDFTYATFSQCSFTDVDLREAIFRNTTISETYFRKCNLAYADFTGARKFSLDWCEGSIIYETTMPNGKIYTCTSETGFIYYR